MHSQKNRGYDEISPRLGAHWQQRPVYNTRNALLDRATFRESES